MRTGSPGRPLGPFKDRRPGLIAFGVVLILSGVVTLAVAIAIPVALKLARTAVVGTAPPLDGRSVVVSVATYAALGVVFLGLGVGSIRLRRWVRPLVLTLAWTWLLTGSLFLCLWLVQAPDLSALVSIAGAAPEDLGHGLMSALAVVLTACVVSIGFLLPALLVGFYRSPHVRATLERCDARESWVDRCPPPVLGLSISLWLGAGATLLMLVYGFFPVLGLMLTGAPAVLLILASAGLLAYLGRATYRLSPGGWWGTLIVLVAMPLLGAGTALQGDPLEMYRHMGVPDEELKMIRKMGFLDHRLFYGLTLVFVVASIGYMVNVRKHFLKDRPREGAP